MDNLNSLLPCPKTSSQKEYQKVKNKKLISADFFSHRRLDSRRRCYSLETLLYHS